MSRSLGRAAGGAQGLFAQLGQLLSQGAGADDAFDAVADLYLEDGVDEALPAMVGLAVRSAARGLGLRNVAQLSLPARRALVRGIAAAARELGRTGGPQAVRALPRLAHSAARTAQRQVPTPQRAVQLVRRGLPRAAQRVARNPGMVRRLARQSSPRPLARTTSIGRGMRSAGSGRERVFNISGPATLRITPR
jgi:GNAT superfamily N-acetyltransferase